MKYNRLTILVTGAVLEQPSSRMLYSGVGTSSGATNWVMLMLLLLATHLAPGCSVCLIYTGWEYYLMSPHGLDVT